MVIPASSTDHPEQPSAPHLKSAPINLDLQDLQLHLSLKLQTSLDIEAVLLLFFETSQKFLRFDGLTYRYDDAQLSLTYGTIQTHSVDYKISSSDHYLGQICFSRESRFAEAELAALEILIGGLFHPLRNALRYREAVASSLRDPLTKVGNRAALTEAMKRELELARRYQRPFSLMLIDIDHFKKINDTIGHSAGDTALQHLVEKISANLRQVDEVFRYGGEEFVVLLGQTDREAAVMVAERIRQSLIQDPLRLEGEPLPLTVSIGLSMYRADDSEESLFDRADQALYQAKHNGRNCVSHIADCAI